MKTSTINYIVIQFDRIATFKMLTNKQNVLQYICYKLHYERMLRKEVE